MEINQKGCFPCIIHRRYVLSTDVTRILVSIGNSSIFTLSGGCELLHNSGSLKNFSVSFSVLFSVVCGLTSLVYVLMSSLVHSFFDFVVFEIFPELSKSELVPSDSEASMIVGLCYVFLQIKIFLYYYFL